MHHSSQGMYKKNILSKSLNTEVLKTSSSILMILFLLVVGSRFVGYFEKAAEGLMDPSLIFSVIFLRFPDFITLLIPLSFFLGILISISRLYAEREIYGYISVGLSQLDLVKFLAPQAFIYFSITLILSLYVAPYTKALSQEIMSIDSFEEQIESMKPDKIYSFEDGRAFIYAKAINDGVLEDVKIFRTDDNGSNLIMAEQLRVNKDNRQLELDFKSGVFYKGIFSDQRQVISSFEKFISPVDRDIDRVSGLSMAKIFDYSAESEKANLQWNISIPATLIILLFLGVYMGAVKPDDIRYKDLIGKNIVLPFVGRKIPILADDYVDMEFGTGCLKITPGHDFNDYEIGKKYSLHEVNGQVETSETDSDFEPINIFNDDAWSNDNVPAPFNNLDRFKVRKLVIEKLSELSLLEKEEKYHISVPRGERSNVVIEPKLSHQWYVKTSEMAARANKAVNNGDIKFHPQNWDKTYFNWMDNIQDWCISRQIWWGHRIPAWYDTEGNVYVGHNEEEIRTQYNLDTRELKQDDDVLDTWFSSSLWPFASMGWPHETDDFKKHFPTSLLVTGFDIIFFWVARMMMMSLEFTDQIPFKDVYVTGLIRDENGQKMSKSKGNVIDPLDLIYGISQDALVEKRTSNLMQEKIAQKIERKTRNQFPKGIESYGTDALRMTFYSLATHTKDISFEFGRLKGYRNFCTKIWNAARFINGYPAGNEIFDPKTDADQLIMDEFQKTKNKIQKNIEDYRLDFAINEVYEFFWSKFCDVYIEECKKSGKTDNLRPMLKEILVMMHPFAPFITEEIHSLLFKSQIIE
ncbi:LptF/LptG family permease [Gammaproteobacteria bacterium]|nr:LptF/LptG family permease [Gammaproteobacteria bacterium]